LKVNGINKEMQCIQVIKLNLIACQVYKSVRPQCKVAWLDTSGRSCKLYLP
jgi:hypothetical protein